MTELAASAAPTARARLLRIAQKAKAAGPALLFGVRLWASVCLALYLAFYLELDNAYWAGVTAAITCQPQLGASLRKGWYRMIGTVIGAMAIVGLTAAFPQARAPFLIALALWGAACAFAATLLHNFASYAAALAGYTAVIIASDELGLTGGPNADEVFLLAIIRASEICIGIISAGIILAGTDFGGARRRLAGLLAALPAEITGRFTTMLSLAGQDMPETRPFRRELVRRVIALDPIIDQAKGESSQIRYHSKVLQAAVDGLFAGLASWRTVAALLARLPDGHAREEAKTVLDCLPQDLRLAEQGVPAEWVDDPSRMRESAGEAVHRLTALPASTPSLRLLADKTARLFAGISDALNGLASLSGARANEPPGRRFEIRVPDWLPPLVNAARTFLTIGAVAIFWILTAWPNGAEAVVYAAIAVILFAPRADQAYGSAVGFAAGAALGTFLSAIIKFAVLPGLETFEAFTLVAGLYLIPGAALMTQPRYTTVFTYMTVYFCSYIQPANVMSYDTQQYFNTAVALIAGTGAAALSFRLLPPLSPAYRTHRLLARSLRDLRRLAAGHSSCPAGTWESHLYGRLAAMPEAARPLQRAQLLTALSVGSEIIRLRPIACALGFARDLGLALDALACGQSAAAARRLARLDERLASPQDRREGAVLALQGRGSILAISQALAEHGAFFDAGECA